MDDINKAASPSSKTREDTSFGSVATDIKDAAAKKFDEAMTDVRSKAHDAKDGVADEVHDVADALRRASEELRGGSAQERTLGTIAGSIADVSDQIRDKDLGEMAQMVSKVARENPILFLSGAALLGFAISRYAKATSTEPAPSAPYAGSRASGDVAAANAATFGQTQSASKTNAAGRNGKDDWSAKSSATVS